MAVIRMTEFIVCRPGVNRPRCGLRRIGPPRTGSREVGSLGPIDFCLVHTPSGGYLAPGGGILPSLVVTLDVTQPLNHPSGAVPASPTILGTLFPCANANLGLGQVFLIWRFYGLRRI